MLDIDENIAEKIAVDNAGWQLQFPDCVGNHVIWSRVPELGTLDRYAKHDPKTSLDCDIGCRPAFCLRFCLCAAQLVWTIPSHDRVGIIALGDLSHVGTTGNI